MSCPGKKECASGGKSVLTIEPDVRILSKADTEEILARCAQTSKAYLFRIPPKCFK